MRITNKLKTEYVKNKLSTNDKWALAGLVVVYKNQTPDEQDTGIAHYDNNKGFTGVDANFMTSPAKQYESRGSLSPKQMVCVRKNMKKYHKQILLVTNDTKLIGCMHKDGLVSEGEIEKYKGNNFIKALDEV